MVGLTPPPLYSQIQDLGSKTLQPLFQMPIKKNKRFRIRVAPANPHPTSGYAHPWAGPSPETCVNEEDQFFSGSCGCACFFVRLLGCPIRFPLLVNGEWVLATCVQSKVFRTECPKMPNEKRRKKVRIPPPAGMGGTPRGRSITCG